MRSEPVTTIVTVLCSLVVALSGCSGSETATTTAADTAELGPVNGDTLVVGYKADVDVLNPLVTVSNLGLEILEVLFPVTVGMDFDCRCVPRAGIAERWDWSDDGTAVTFHLRDGLVWSDGETIDADDVAASWDRIADPAVGSAWAPFTANFRKETPYVITDPRTITLHFEHAYDRTTMMAHAAGCPLAPEHALRDTPSEQLRAAPFSSSPITAGPFRFGAWTKGQQLELVRDDRAGQAARLDRVIFKIVPEYATRLLELQNGSIDMMPGLQLEDVDRIQAQHPEIKLYRRSERNSDFIAWNLRDPRFADVRVRTALAHAVDVETLMDALLTAGGVRYARRAVGTITPAICDAHNDQIVPLAHDPQTARALLAEAGWTDTDGDGLVDKEGEPLRFTLMTNQGNARREQAQVIIQQQFREVGVDVTLQTLESNTVFQRMKEGNYEAAMSGVMANMFVDPTNRWRSDGKPFNHTGYANPQVDALIDQGLATTDPEEANRCWREMQALIYADQPYCFLYWRDDVVAVHQRFRDVKINVLGVFGNVGQWWVPTAEQKY